MIYPFWLLLIFKTDVFLWSLGTLVVLLVLAGAGVLGFVPIEIAALGMSIAVVITGLRLGRYFLVRMVVDFDARNGDGAVIIERLIPAPTLPESISISLQDAAEGQPEVNTKGLINTLITVLKPLTFLRIFTVGDLTLRVRGSDFSATMYGIQDPVGVKNQLQGYWKKISAIKAKQQAERERLEQIERMSIAVAEGLRRAQETLKVQLVRPVDGEAPAAPNGAHLPAAEDRPTPAPDAGPPTPPAPDEPGTAE